MAVSDRALHGKVVYRGVHVVARFKLDRDGIRKLAVGPALRHAVHSLAEHKAKPYAVGQASKFADSGHYASSFKLDDGFVTISDLSGRYPMRRVMTALVNEAVYAAVVEVGGKDPRQPARHVLLKTLEFLAATSFRP